MIVKTLGVAACVAAVSVAGAMPSSAAEWDGAGMTPSAAIASVQKACEQIGAHNKGVLFVHHLRSGIYIAGIDCR